MNRIVKTAALLAFAAIGYGVSAPATNATPAPTPTHSAQSLNTSYYSGTIAVGASQTNHWNNAPAANAYVLGLAPTGASTSTSCVFQVTRTWYVQEYGGEKEFYWTIKNIGSIACGTQVNLYSIANSTSAWSTGGLNPGQSTTKHWNNANPLDTTYVVGLTPSGATSTSPCQMQVTRRWYQQQPGGEREFWFTVQNVGNIACTSNILLGQKTTSNTLEYGAMTPGQSANRTWNNASTTAGYIVGFSPKGASSSAACQYESSNEAYAARINSDGSTEHEFRFTVKNVGTVNCATTRLLATA